MQEQISLARSRVKKWWHAILTAYLSDKQCDHDLPNINPSVFHLGLDLSSVLQCWKEKN